MRSLTWFTGMARRKYFGLFFAMTLAVEVSPVMAQATDVPPVSAHLPVDLDHAINVVGMGDLKRSASGHLMIDDTKMNFVTRDSRVEIPASSIRAFSVAHDNVPLISGTKGAIAGMAPYGVGQLTNALRPGADMVTVVYVDEHSAVHGSVLLLPKGKGHDVTQALAKFGLSPRAYPQSSPVPLEATDKSVLRKDMEGAQGKPAIQVALLTESADDIPAAFPVGAYEELIAQLTRSGMFEKVWRQGDNRVDANALTLHVNIQELHKGSARARGLVPFVGATRIKVDVRLTDARGKVLFDHQIDAAKRLRGENLSVTKGLAKKIKSELMKLPNLVAASPQNTMS